MSTFREPFSLDVVVRTLSKVPFSPPFLILLPLLALALDRRHESVAEVLQTLPTFRGWQALLFDKYKWFGRAMVFIVIRMVNKFFAHRAENHGETKADPADWSKDVVVITGGSTGIGKTVVEILSKEYKARIAVLDISEPTYEAAAPDAPPILWIKTDVSSREAIKAARKVIEEKFGVPPSIVIGSAGIAIGGPLLTVTPESLLKTMNINAIANVHMAQEFVPYMVKNNHGHFVTVASSASYFTPPMLSSYSMSKAAVLAFHEELRTELRVLYKAPRVRTSIVTPMKVRTNLGHALQDSENKFMTPTLEPIQVARAITDALNDGFSRAIAQPQMAKVLPFVRAMPQWLRSFVETVGRTDRAVTAESIRAGLQHGYGKNWSKEDFDTILGEMSRSYNQ